jgi:hypothetical protein
MVVRWRRMASLVWSGNVGLTGTVPKQRAASWPNEVSAPASRKGTVLGAAKDGCCGGRGSWTLLIAFRAHGRGRKVHISARLAFALLKLHGGRCAGYAVIGRGRARGLMQGCGAMARKRWVSAYVAWLWGWSRMFGMWI